MGMVNSNGSVVINIKETTLTIKDMATERCFGLMATFTEDIGKREFKMALAL